MLIIRTSNDTLNQVVRHELHALQKRPIFLRQGDIILIAQKKPVPANMEPIRYLMKYDHYYFDKSNESDDIFGKHWEYIIVGKAFKQLKKPFDICKIQKTKTNYAQGGTIVYVSKEDEDFLRTDGYLETQEIKQ